MSYVTSMLPKIADSGVTTKTCDTADDHAWLAAQWFPITRFSISRKRNVRMSGRGSARAVGGRELSGDGGVGSRGALSRPARAGDKAKAGRPMGRSWQPESRRVG